jgi:hypothetical protein
MRSLQLKELVAAFSHAFRTPLGTALGVVDDAVTGMPLKREDFSDAKKSLIHLKDLVDALRIFECDPGAPLESLPLASLIRGLTEKGKLKSVLPQKMICLPRGSHEPFFSALCSVLASSVDKAELSVVGESLSFVLNGSRGGMFRKFSAEDCSYESAIFKALESFLNESRGSLTYNIDGAACVLQLRFPEIEPFQAAM